MDLAAPKLQSRTSRQCTECKATLSTLLKKRNLDRLIVSEIIKRLQDPKISRIPGFFVSVRPLTLLSLRMVRSKVTITKNPKRSSTRLSGMINPCEGRKTDNRQNVRLIWTSRGAWMRWLNRNRELERMKSDGSAMHLTTQIMTTRQAILSIFQPSRWWRMQASLTALLQTPSQTGTDLDHKYYKYVTLLSDYLNNALD